MFEQVGEDQLPVYFQHANHILKPGGVFLNHGIARRVDEKTWDSRMFSDAYVFPDGELSPISHTLRVAEESGFEVRDVESLREHYVHTLSRWVANLVNHHDEAVKYVDEPTYRVWRAYMSAAQYGFRSGRLNLYQSLLHKPAGPDGEQASISREANSRPIFVFIAGSFEHHFVMAGELFVDPLHDQVEVAGTADKIQVIRTDGQDWAQVEGLHPVFIV